jgi:hypothetical protein
MQNRVSSFGLRVDRISIDGLLSAAATLFSNYVVQIVTFFHRAAPPRSEIEIARD